MKRIVILGGGASGMVAAIQAARTDQNAKVYIIEQKDALGKKLLATGNGRCNLTNENMKASFYRSDQDGFVSQILEKFDEKATLRFFAELGLMTKSRDGYIYPRSDQAQTLVNLLVEELKKQNVIIKTGTRVLKVEHKNNLFEIHTEKELLKADALILACGGKAQAELGSDGSGYDFAKAFGHHLSPVVPALVPLKVQNFSFKKASGVRTQAKVSAIIKETPVASDRGELQITAYGLSGIPIFQISRYVSKALYEGHPVKVRVDFLPELSPEDFYAWICQQKNSGKDPSLSLFLTGIFNGKLVTEFLKKSHLPGGIAIKELKEAQWEKLIAAIKSQEFLIEDSMGFSRAQVCAGGVLTREVSPANLESKYVKNLYLTGELLDVDGICGGYNLQWAFASGYLAGKDVAK